MHSLITVCWALAATGLAAQEEKLTLGPVEQWTTLFSGKNVEFRFQVKAPAGFAGRAGWTFAAENGRVLPRGRGEAPLKAAAKQVVQFKVPLTTPDVKDGVILPTRLSVFLVADGKSAPEATLDIDLFIFPSDPFVERTQWLQDLKISLWDPDPKTRTAAAFKDLKIPFDEAVNVNALAAVKEGMLIVGEGASFKEEPALGETLLQAAGRGLPVLCLAPAEGSLPWPAARGEGPLPVSVTLRRQDIIRQLDKRLDAQAWSADGKVIVAAFDVKAVEGKVLAEFAGQSGWPWLELEYSGKGRLVVCGFAFVQHWQTSPTPRYLLARLFEHLTLDREKESPPKADQLRKKR